MLVTTPLTQAGYLPDDYAKYADEANKQAGRPIVSFPFEIDEIPKSAKYVAWSLVDYDSIPVAGFAWIHWCVANVPVEASKLMIPADFSRQTHTGIQGKNSLYSKFVDETDPVMINHYIGPTPPDQPHAYHLAVYAMPEPLSLTDGFFLNEARRELSGNVLAQADLDIWARN